MDSELKIENHDKFVKTVIVHTRMAQFSFATVIVTHSYSQIQSTRMCNFLLNLALQTFMSWHLASKACFLIWLRTFRLVFAKKKNRIHGLHDYTIFDLTDKKFSKGDIFKK